MAGHSRNSRRVSLHRPFTGTIRLRLALALELGLLLVPQLLIELGSLAGLVAVHLRGQGSVNLAQTVLLAQLVVVLLLALRLALKLVGDGSLILCMSLVGET